MISLHADLTFKNSLIYSLQFVLGNAQEEDIDEHGRSHGFHGPDRPCSYRHQQGVCRRRSTCRRPTRHTCRLGLNPIVCCLDEPEVTTTTTKTTKRPVITREPDKHHDSVKEIDLTFPGMYQFSRT